MSCSAIEISKQCSCMLLVGQPFFKYIKTVHKAAHYKAFSSVR